MSLKLEIVIAVEVYSSADELPKSERQLLKQAEKAAEKAYAPYSGFLVGAALLMEDDSFYLGNNQENAAYPSGLCAERTALFGLRITEHTKKIKMIAVTARKVDTAIFVAATPCGACRQVMAEYENLQGSPIAVLMQAENGKIYRCQSVEALLPLQFSRDNLAI